NVLVMDEPTNHLDIKSKDVLKAALQQFAGTLSLVSHDRDFLQGLSTVVDEFKDQQIKEYLSDINFYLEQRKVDSMREIDMRDTVVKQPVKQEKNLSLEEQRQKKTLQNRLSKIESEIQNLEKQIAQDDQLLAENYEKMVNGMSFFTAYEKKKKDLENLLNEWEAVQMELDRKSTRLNSSHV